MLFDFSDEQVKRAKGGAWISPEGKIHFVQTSFEHSGVLYRETRDENGHGGLTGRSQGFQRGWVHVGFYQRSGDARRGQAVDEVTFTLSSHAAIPALTAAARLARYADLKPTTRVIVDPTSDYTWGYDTPEGKADGQWKHRFYLSTRVSDAGSPDAAMKAAGSRLMAIATDLNAKRRATASQQENINAQAA